jgi:tetratricopeptide (TPR) repeat protein
MKIRRFFLLLAAVYLGLTLSVTAQADIIDAEETDPIDILRADPALATTTKLSAVFEPTIHALDAGDIDTAVELINDLKITHPELPGTWELDGAIKLADGDFEGAEISLERALKLTPQVASIQTKLGAAQLGQNKVAEAERTLTSALRLDPAETSAALMLARLKARQGDFTSALAYYKTAVKRAIGYSIAHQELVEFYLRSGDYEAALDLVRPLLETGGSSAAHMAATRAYISMGRLDEAGESLESARKMGLAVEEATLYAAVLARFAGDLERSESLLVAYLSDYPDRPLFLQELALTLAAAGKSSGSRDAAMNAAALLPEQHPTRVGLANLLLAQGLASEALQVARGNVASGDPQALVVVIRAGILAGDLGIADTASQQLLSVYPQYVEAFTYRSEVLLRMGKQAQAIEIAEQGTRSLPQSVAAWSARVGLLLRLGAAENAVQVAEMGVNAIPESTELRLQWANALQLNGELDAAEGLYQELVGDQNASVIALNNLANMVSASPNRRPEALEYARKAHLLAPDSAAINDTLGWVLHLNGNNKEARKMLDIAYASAADDVEVICHLGIVKAGLDGVEAARNHLEQCAANDSDLDLSSQAASLLGKS